MARLVVFDDLLQAEEYSTEEFAEGKARILEAIADHQED
jgi:hypothetical protein